MDPDIVIPLAGMLTAIILGLPVVRTITRLVERKVGRPGGGDLEALRAEVRELRDAVDATGELHERLVDLEERADFTERLLTQGPPRDREDPKGA